jgi:hypothetical protein
MKLMRAPMLACAGIILGLTALAISGARAQDTTTTPRYSEWQGGASNKQLQAFVAKLKSMVDEADKAKAADPVFIQDLRDLIASAEAPATPAPVAQPTVRLFYDDFRDGNFTANPVWKATAGQWTVDLLGKNTGLKSTIIPPGQTSSQNLKLGDVLGAILQPQPDQGTANATYASIYTALKISNVFKIRLDLVSKERFGRLDFGPYQGAGGNTAYRVTYFPGGNPGLALQRVTAQGTATIGSYNQPLSLEGDKSHAIEFLRDGAGAMTVSVDGKALISVKDTTITKPFDGFLMINSGGRYAIGAVTIDGVS